MASWLLLHDCHFTGIGYERPVEYADYDWLTPGEGGAAYIFAFDYVSITNCSFDRNVAFSGAGALLSQVAFTTVAHSNFTDNRFMNAGGGLNFMDCLEFQVSHCRFVGNQPAAEWVDF